MPRRQQDFLSTILPTAATSAVTTILLALLASWLYSEYRLRVPGFAPELPPGEQLQHTLGEINAREVAAGRAPFTLTRIAQPARGGLGGLTAERGEAWHGTRNNQWLS
jgi:hypothetical protein